MCNKIKNHAELQQVNGNLEELRRRERLAKSEQDDDDLFFESFKKETLEKLKLRLRRERKEAEKVFPIKHISSWCSWADLIVCILQSIGIMVVLGVIVYAVLTFSAYLGNM